MQALRLAGPSSAALIVLQAEAEQHVGYSICSKAGSTYKLVCMQCRTTAQSQCMQHR